MSENKMISFQLFEEQYNDWKKFADFLGLPFASMIKKSVDKDIENRKDVVDFARKTNKFYGIIPTNDEIKNWDAFAIKQKLTIDKMIQKVVNEKIDNLKDSEKWKAYAHYIGISFDDMIRMCIEEAIKNDKEG